MQNTIVVNCRNFDCLNNKSGECLLAKISLQSDGTSLVSKVICIEAEYKPEVKDAKENRATENNI